MAGEMLQLSRKWSQELGVHRAPVAKVVEEDVKVAGGGRLSVKTNLSLKCGWVVLTRIA